MPDFVVCLVIFGGRWYFCLVARVVPFIQSPPPPPKQISHKCSQCSQHKYWSTLPTHREQSVYFSLIECMRSNQIITITKQIFAKFDRLANKFDDLIFAFDLFVWAVPYLKKKAQVFPYDLILFTNKQFILFELRVPVIWVNHWIFCTYSPAWVLSNIFISRFLNVKYSCLVLI